jgi:hypothetical protein
MRKFVLPLLVMFLMLFTSCRSPVTGQSAQPRLSLVLSGLPAQEMINAPIYYSRQTPSWNILIKPTTLAAGAASATVYDVRFYFAHSYWKYYIRIEIEYENPASEPRVFKHSAYLDSGLAEGELSIDNVRQLQDFLDQSVGLLVARLNEDAGPIR